MFLIDQVSALLTRLLGAPGDTKSTLAKKKGWACLLIPGILCNPVAVLFGTLAKNPLETYMGVGFFPIVTLCFVWMCITKKLTLGVQLAAMALGLAQTLVYDLAVMPMGYRGWSVGILVLDGLLLARAPPVYRYTSMVLILTWLLVTEVERVYRFGLMDLSVLAAYEDRSPTSCAQPPCASESAYELRGALIPCVTFIADFLATNGFAQAVEGEKAKVEAAVVAARSVASSLASFDLPRATEHLQAAKDTLPDDLYVELHALLENLESYRPYLPDALFRLQKHRASAPVGNPLTAEHAPHAEQIPGLWPSAPVAVAFLDIRNSDQLWEHSGNVMMHALATYSALVRKALAAHRGYEVKTVRAAFMVAFPTVLDAVKFACEVHDAVADDGQWPMGVNRGRHGQTDGFPTLAARVGVAYGDVIVEKNVLTGRYDYFGGVVNAAVRVEKAAVAGTVLLTEEAADEVNGADELRAAAVKYTLYNYDGTLMTEGGCTAYVPESMSQMEEVVRRHANGEATSSQGARVSSQPTAQSSLPHPHLTATGSDPKPPSRATFPSSGRDFRTVSTSAASINDVRDRDGDDFGVRTNRDVLSVCGSMGPALRAHQATASVCVVRLHTHSSWKGDVLADAGSEYLDPTASAVDARTTAMLMLLNQSLQDTRGVLGTVMNNFVVVSWNAHAPCNQFVNSSTKFLMLMNARFSDPAQPDAPLPFHVGLATGTVYSGQVAASESQRFITILGPCVEMGLALCAAAADLGTAALCASFCVEPAYRHAESECLTGAIRPVDEWFADCDVDGGDAAPTAVVPVHADAASQSFAGADDAGWPAAKTVVFEIRMAGLEEMTGAEGDIFALHSILPTDVAGSSEGDGAEQRVEWSRDYSKAFYARDTPLLAKWGERDPVVRQVAAMLRTGAHLPHPLAPAHGRGLRPAIASPSAAGLPPAGARGAV